MNNIKIQIYNSQIKYWRSFTFPIESQERDPTIHFVAKSLGKGFYSIVGAKGKLISKSVL